MRRIGILVLFVWTLGTIPVFAQGTKKKCAFLMNGYFFQERPCNFAVDSDVSATSYLIKLPDGSRIMSLDFPFTFSEEVMSYAIPVEEVENGEEILAAYKKEIATNYTPIITTFKAPISALKVGDPFPAFKAVDMDGKQWSNDDIKGKVMVLNVWYTGCGSCRKEMPELSAWKEEMPTVMFFSSTFETAEIARPVIEKIPFTWIPLCENSQFNSWVGSNGFPLTVVVDTEGIIRQVEYGAYPMSRASLKHTIRSLIH